MRAKVLNVREHPSLNSYLHSSGNDRPHDLTPEHWTMWDLHVMAEFHVAGKLECLYQGDISPRFKQHHRNRAAREGVSDDQLCEDV